MTLLSENAGPGTTPQGTSTAMPVRLLGGMRRGISRLEFSPVHRPEPAIAEVATDGAEVFLEEQVATLAGELQSQAEQRSAEIETARLDAKAEARNEWEEELKEEIEKERSGLMKVCEEFRRERLRYFAGVEAEVVKLALAIAGRVLHREVNLDPLLLAGVVRVALEKVAEGSTAVLRVPVTEMERWEAVVAKWRGSLELKGEDRFRAGECVLETTVGSVELGVKAQLEEIERGFFDLLQQRPA